MYDNNINNQQFTNEPQPPKSPKRRQSTAKVAALLAGVLLVGAGSGFGGAYLAGRANRQMVSEENISSANSSQSGGTDSSSDFAHTESNSDTETSLSTPTLDDLQSGASISHTVSSKAEFNSDGTFMYTRDLVSAVRDSIVYIEVYINYRGNNTLYGTGSGIVISSDGYILTNAHVTDGYDAYTVQVSTTDPETGSGVSNKYDATLVGSDTDTDLAVLKIDADNLQVAVLGDSDALHLGDDVVAIGNPLGLETSVSKGIVSGLNRQLSDSNRSLSSIQTDAAINSGNSGGALFNMYGEVVGVVNEKLINNYAENVGFAITINEAKDVINDLISKGYVTGRPILGITCIQVSEYVAAIQNMTPGLYVTNIEKDLAIAKSELVVGDTITKINGTSVTSVDGVSEIIKDMKPGDTVSVTVVRTDSLGRDTEMTFDVILSEYNGS